jgi:Glucose-6-phosphate 1-dehydrogenase
MIKKILKGLGRLAALSVILTLLYLVNLFFMKPYSIDHYLGKELVFGLMDFTEAMTYIGVFDRLIGLTKHNSKLSIPRKMILKRHIKFKKSIKTLYNTTTQNIK